ncbi:MFS transporter [Shinella sp. CPCC 100929]|uniref:MFS transporter n=1 Tax=Shinella lacus TaxID=2654216 RepID=A0ABT1RC10_9HYPH|nr:MFS transporter [Shinella lacus]MCQ4632721.1 MFS transporter [Shinella lacus]
MVPWKPPLRITFGKAITRLLSGGLAAGSGVWGATAKPDGLSVSLQWAAVAHLVTAVIGFIVPVQLSADGDQEGID